MVTNPQSRLQAVNPRLTTNYAIFSSSVFCIFLLLAIFEQLGINQNTLTLLALFIPTVIISAIGLIASTNRITDYFISGRRVPAVYNGMAIASTSFGGAALLGFIGSIFFIGHDALAIGIGWVAGILLMGVLFAPYMRKIGAYTIPGFFAQRYESNVIRLLTLFIIILPVFIILIAEINIAIYSLSILFNQPKTSILLFVIAVIFISIAGGGMRSLTWTQCAKSLIIKIGLLLPLIIVAVQETNLPIPQLTYGTTLDNISTLENQSGIKEQTAGTIKNAIPQAEITFLKTPTLQNFGSITLTQFVFLALSIMVGAACLPAVLIRMSTTPTVYEARKSTAWGVAFLALIIISIPAYAIFTKLILFQNLQQFTPDQLPTWMIEFQKNNIISFGNTDKAYLDMQSLGLNRDAVLPILPSAANFPFILVALVVSVAFFAATSAASAQILLLSNMISHDIIYSLFSPRLSETTQINLSRLSILIITTILSLIIINSKIDSFKLILYALTMLGSSIFPALIMSIWWKNCKKSAIMLGMLAGLASAISIILLSEQGIHFFGIEGYTATIISAPICILVAVITSIMSPEPIDIKNNVLDDTRIPGGETIYDRTLRNKIRKQQKAIALEEG